MMAEAMLNDTPVIATNWSSNTEFMNEKVACMVDYKFTELEKDCPPYKKGAVWADPDVKEAAKFMRKLYSDKVFYNQLAKDAKAFVSKKLGPPYKKGAVWADPDVKEAAKFMRKLYSDKVFYNQLAKDAKAFVSKKLGMAQAVSLIESRIEKIYKKD